MHDPIEAAKQAARKRILDSDLISDRNQVIERWTNTFVDIDPADGQNTLATQIMMFAMATVAQGDFSVSTSGQPGNFTAPFAAFNIADYFSHGQRVMIDYSALSRDNQDLLSKYFPLSEFAKRTSPFRFRRNEDGSLVEFEDKRSAIKQSLLFPVEAWVGKDVSSIGNFFHQFGIEGSFFTEFGLNIRMGGVAKPNLSGGQSAPGYDGHILLTTPQREHEFAYTALMIGLEETSPTTVNDIGPFLQDVGAKVIGGIKTVTNAVTSLITKTPSQAAITAPEESKDNKATDTIAADSTGLSGKDTTGKFYRYTAAGSLAFDNPIQKVKLATHALLPPAALNGMRVTLTDANLRKVIDFYKKLADSSAKKDVATLGDLLKKQPSSTDESRILSLIRKDKTNAQITHNTILSFVKNFTEAEIIEFFQQIDSVYEETNQTTLMPEFVQKLRQLQGWMATPRSLSAADVKPLFGPEDSPSTNPNITRLKNVFNNATKILQKRAWAGLKEAVTQNDEIFIKAKQLDQAYQTLGDKLDMAGETIALELFGDLSALEEKVSEINTFIQAQKKSPSITEIMPHLIELDTIKEKLSKLINSNESRLILKLATELKTATEQLAKQGLSLSDQLAILQDQRRSLGENREQVKQNAATIAAFEQEKTSLQRLNDDLIAENRKLSEEIGAVNAVLDVFHSSTSTPSEPDAPVATTPAPQSNCSFLLSCLSSAKAFNTYGFLLIVTSVAILSATLSGAVALSIGAGATIAAAGLLLGSYCFFKACTHSDGDVIEPKNSDTLVIQSST